MTKKYIVNYKIIEYEKLKKVSYHGYLTYPIYIQISFRRQTTLIKSHYFNFFSKSRLILGENQEPNSYPNIEEITLMEQNLLEYVIKKVDNTDTLESVTKKYHYYSKDICLVLEESFALTMNLFLREKNLNILAKKLIIEKESEILYFLLQDLSLSLRPELYDGLLTNALNLKQYYVQLFEYILIKKSSPNFYLSVMEWNDPKFILGFTNYLKDVIPDGKEVISNINKLIL